MRTLLHSLTSTLPLGSPGKKEVKQTDMFSIQVRLNNLFLQLFNY